MAGHSRPKDGVASLAYVPAIHVFLRHGSEGVDARNKCGHDELVAMSVGCWNGSRLTRRLTLPSFAALYM
jgi:hypothetical protein